MNLTATRALFLLAFMILLLARGVLPAQEERVVLFVVQEEDVVVRAEPGYIFKEVGRLRKGDEVIVEGEREGWLRLAGGRGWVPAGALHPKPLLPERRRIFTVNTENARVRLEPNTSSPIVASLRKGERIEVMQEKDGWLRIPDRGWIKGTLVDVSLEGETPGGGGTASSPARDPAPAPAAAPSVAGPGDLRAWGLLSLTGVYLKVTELPAGHPTCRDIQREVSKAMGEDKRFTYFLLMIDVPPSCPYSFNFSPEENRVILVMRDGREFGNFVHKAGSLGGLPPSVRNLFEPKSVMPGSVGQNILLFREGLPVQEVAKVLVVINGKSQEIPEI